MHLVAPRTTSGLWLCFECLWAAASGEICSHDPSKCRDCRVLPPGVPHEFENTEFWGWRCLCCVCYVWEAWLLRTRQYLPARCTTNSSLQSLQDFDPSVNREIQSCACCAVSLDMESALNLLICHHLVTRCHTSSLKEQCINMYIYIYIYVISIQYL